MEDEDDTARRARKAAGGEGDAGRTGGAGGGGADSADVAESGADVDRLGLGKMVAGVLSAEASRAVEDKAVIGEDDFGGAGGGDDGAAVVLTGAVVVGSRADVVDQRTVAGGHMLAGSGMIRSFEGGLERRDQAPIDGTGFGAAVGVASCIQGPELQARFRADVGRPDAEARFRHKAMMHGAIRAMAYGGQYGRAEAGLRAGRDVALGQGAASWALSPESRANVVMSWRSICASPRAPTGAPTTAVMWDQWETSGSETRQ